MTGDNIRILIADDHAILRKGLHRILESEPDMLVIAEAATGAEAVQKALDLKPDVVLLDVGMPQQDGIRALEQILKGHSCRVIMLSVLAEHHLVSSALAAGAAGYLVKDIVDTELVAAIRAVFRGGTVFSGTVSKALTRGSSPERGPTEQTLAALTAREREIFLLLAEGKGPSEIAQQLYVSPKTVHTHRQHINDKLGFRSTTDLIRFALREGFIKQV